MQDISKYEKIKEDTGEMYQKIKRIKCPLFNDWVYFNSEGFNHLIYKKSRTERSKNDQLTKFKLVSKACELVAKTTTYQEYEESVISVRKKRHKKIIFLPETVKYWAFVAIMKEQRIKTIVRQVGSGNKHFWSVIPAWSTSQYKSVKLVNNSKGNLKED